MSASSFLRRKVYREGVRLLKPRGGGRSNPSRGDVRTLANSHVGLLGVPFNQGQTKPGVSCAPQILRENGIIERLHYQDCMVQDHGDMKFDVLPATEDPSLFHIRYPRTNGRMAKKVSNRVQKIIESGQVALNIGGDHSIGIGTVHGALQARPDSVVIWVDAHTDINLPLTSPSGNIHGMVLAFLLHELQQYMFKINGFEWCKSCLSAKDLVYIGIREMDPAEKYLVEQLNIKCYTPDDIDKHGLDYVLEHSMDAVNPGMRRPVHLSFDVDALDPKFTPATGTPVPGGLTMDEGLFICDEISNSGKLLSMDLVEVNRDLGKTEEDKQITVNNSLDLVEACFTRREQKNRAPHKSQNHRINVIES